MNSSWISDLQLPNFEEGQEFSAGFPNFPLQDGGGEGFPSGGLSDICLSDLLRETTGENTGQGSGSGLAGWNGVAARCNGFWVPVSGSGPQGEYEVKPGRVWEQGSGSGLPQVNNAETDRPTAVSVATQPQAGEKRYGKAAEYSRNHRNKKKRLEEETKLKMEELCKENEELRRNSRESNKKLDDLQARIRQDNEKYILLEEEYARQQSQIDILTRSLEKMSFLQEENRKLKTENDRLTQQLNANFEGEIFAKKSLKMPLENAYLKIKGNVLHLKRLD